MSSALPKFTPADHAKRLEAIANQILQANSAPRPRRTPQANSVPQRRRTIESPGYRHTFVSPLDTGAKAMAKPPVVDDTDYQPSPGWLPPAELLGLDWTPRLRRFTSIDPMDPTEALDATEDYLGVHVFTP